MLADGADDEADSGSDESDNRGIEGREKGLGQCMGVSRAEGDNPWTQRNQGAQSPAIGASLETMEVADRMAS